MSLLNDITGAVGIRTTPVGGQPTTIGAGQQPGAPSAAQQLQSRFGSVFQKTFSSSMATVFERGAAGEFDDPTLKLQEQAALQRLRAAQQGGTTDTTATPGAQEHQGADAAPDAAGREPATTASSGDAGVAEQREIFQLHQRQSEARLTNISSSLARDFPLAAKLVSASTGSWDPATFVPRTREEAEAFAQRMVIDATESAARLEIVKTQLDSARFEAQHGGGAAALATVRSLEAAYTRQSAYVDKLTRIVDVQSNGDVTDAGVDALNGRSSRDASDISTADFAQALRESGMDESQVARVVGAAELSVEQEKTPGGSPRLKQVASDMTQTLLAQFNDRYRRMEEQRRDNQQERDQQRRLDDRRYEQRHAEQQMTQQVQEQRHAEFQQWIQVLDQASAQRRAEREAS